MAFGNISGISYVVSDDPSHPTVTPEDTKVIAKSIAARIREWGLRLSTRVDTLSARMDALAVASEQAPGSPTDGAVAGFILDTKSLTRSAMTGLFQTILDTAIQALPQTTALHVADYGVVGDGTTDDTAAFQAAAAAAATFGVPLVVPEGMTIGISSYKRLPPGLTLRTNGCTFRQLVAMGRNPVIGLGARSTVAGGLHVLTRGGDNCQGVHLSDANDTVIDYVDVRADTPGAGQANIRDNALRIMNSSGVRIGRVYVENYSWPVWAELSNGLRLGWVEASSYAKAIHIDGCSQLQIQGGRVYGVAPNSQYAPGYNGILIEADVPTQDIHIQNLVIEDSGEHGVRLSGPAVQREVYFQNCVTRRSGGTGFKVLGSLVEDRRYNTGVTFDNCVAIDSGMVNQNCCGFLIQMAQHVTLINPVVRRMDNDYSAVEGIRLGGVMHLRVISPKIMDTYKFGVHLDEACGNIQDVTFTNTHIQTPSGHGIYLQNPGVEFRDIRFKGGLVEVYDGDGAAFYAGRHLSEDTGTWRGMNELEMTFSDSTGASRQVSKWSSATALGAFIANLVMWRGADAASSWPPFAEGSMALDRRLGTRQIMSGGAWRSTTTNA